MPEFLQKIQDLFSDGIARCAPSISRPVDEHELRGDLEHVVSELGGMGSLRTRGAGAPFGTLSSTASAVSLSSSTTCNNVSNCTFVTANSVLSVSEEIVHHDDVHDVTLLETRSPPAPYSLMTSETELSMRSLSLEDTSSSEVGVNDLMPFPSKYLSSLKAIEANYRPLRELDEMLCAQISAVMSDASKALINMATRSGVLKVSTVYYTDMYYISVYGYVAKAERLVIAF